MKKVITAVLLFLVIVPVTAVAASNAELQEKINELSRQLELLKAQVAAQAQKNDEVASSVGELEESVEGLDERASDWDLSSRFIWNGDFRARADFYSADTAGGRNLENDSIYSNRLRLNMRVHATENIEFKGRLAMYKTWGQQSAWNDSSGSMYPVFDGNVTRTPREDSALYVDRAYVNWNGIADSNFWFSIGRRPTADGYPANLRMNNKARMATPMAFMDWPFDGLTLGYAYNWDEEATGRIRFCYGRGFESGLNGEEPGSIEDMDFAGIAWDLYKKEDRFLYVQSYMADNLISYPNFQDPIINANFGQMTGMGQRKNLGKVWHSTAVYMDKIGAVNFFLAGGFSRTDPNENGMFNNPMLGPNTGSENGYSIYTGIRYDLDQAGLRFGVEYNHGSQYWLGMSPGHDDIYASKLAARGDVWEIYSIWNIPGGEKISRYANTFIRLGWQHYTYDYTGSGDWNMLPLDINSAAEMQMLQMMGMDSIEEADQIYLTFEAYF